MALLLFGPHARYVCNYRPPNTSITKYPKGNILIVTKPVLCLLALVLAPVGLLSQQIPSSSSMPVTPSPGLVAEIANPPDLPAATAPQPATVPEAPSALLTLTDAGFSSSQQPSTPQSTDTSQTPANETPEERKARAAAQLKQEETQRMGGIIPNFNAVNNGVAEPLTPGQKFQLFFRGSVDPYQFALAGIDALIGQAENNPEGYFQGLKGFGRRYGANYGDNFDGNFWGNAVLPSLLHQDSRYFRMGHGPILKRAGYSISTTFRARSDSGKWQPNYSNLMGNLIGGSISNLYYPDGERGLYPTLRRGLSITYQGTIGALLEEFYPDVSDHFKRKHREKLARQAAAAAQH